MSEINNMTSLYEMKRLAHKAHKDSFTTVASWESSRRIHAFKYGKFDEEFSADFVFTIEYATNNATTHKYEILAHVRNGRLPDADMIIHGENTKFDNTDLIINDLPQHVVLDDSGNPVEDATGNKYLAPDMHIFKYLRNVWPHQYKSNYGVVVSVVRNLNNTRSIEVWITPDHDSLDATNIEMKVSVSTSIFRDEHSSFIIGYQNSCNITHSNRAIWRIDQVESEVIGFANTLDTEEFIDSHYFGTTSKSFSAEDIGIINDFAVRKDGLKILDITNKNDSVSLDRPVLIEFSELTDVQFRGAVMLGGAAGSIFNTPAKFASTADFEDKITLRVLDGEDGSHCPWGQIAGYSADTTDNIDKPFISLNFPELAYLKNSEGTENFDVYDNKKTLFFSRKEFGIRVKATNGASSQLYLGANNGIGFGIVTYDNINLNSIGGDICLRLSSSSSNAISLVGETVYIGESKQIRISTIGGDAEVFAPLFNFEVQNLNAGNEVFSESIITNKFKINNDTVKLGGSVPNDDSTSYNAYIVNPFFASTNNSGLNPGQMAMFAGNAWMQNGAFTIYGNSNFIKNDTARRMALNIATGDVDIDNGNLNLNGILNVVNIKATGRSYIHTLDINSSLIVGSSTLNSPRNNRVQISDSEIAIYKKNISNNGRWVSSVDTDGNLVFKYEAL